MQRVASVSEPRLCAGRWQGAKTVNSLRRSHTQSYFKTCHTHTHADHPEPASPLCRGTSPSRWVRADMSASAPCSFAAKTPDDCFPLFLPPSLLCAPTAFNFGAPPASGGGAFAFGGGAASAPAPAFGGGFGAPAAAAGGFGAPAAGGAPAFGGGGGFGAPAAPAAGGFGAPAAPAFGASTAAPAAPAFGGELTIHSHKFTAN